MFVDKTRATVRPVCACCGEFAFQSKCFSLNAEYPARDSPLLPPSILTKMQTLLRYSGAGKIQMGELGKPSLAVLDGLALQWRVLPTALDTEYVPAGINEELETITLCQSCLQFLLALLLMTSCLERFLLNSRVSPGVNTALSSLPDSRFLSSIYGVIMPPQCETRTSNSNLRAIRSRFRKIPYRSTKAGLCHRRS
jgi:hypothetical protein